MYTVKLARTNLPAMATGKLFRRSNYLQRLATFSAGIDCPLFPQVTAGNLAAPGSNLRERFIVRVKVDFFKPRDVSFYLVANNLNKLTTCSFSSQWKALQTQFCSENVPLLIVGCSIRYPKKTGRSEVLHYGKCDQQVAVVTSTNFSHLSSEGKIQSKPTFWLQYRLKHNAF